MSFRKLLTILVLDDNEQVLQHFKANLESSISVDGMTIDIKVATVQIKLVSLVANDYQISDETIRAIADACRGPLNYIVTDFAFVGDTQKNEALTSKLEAEARGVEATDLSSGSVYQMEAIRKRYEEMLSAKELTYQQRRRFRKFFLHHHGPIKVYTNSPEPFACHFAPTRLAERRLEYRHIFSKSKAIDFILMHELFYITPSLRKQFDGGFKSYYSKLLGQRLKEEIHVLALENMVKAQHKLRFLETRKAYRKLTAAGIGFGAVVALVGEVAYHSLDGFREHFLRALSVRCFDSPMAREMGMELGLLLVCGIVCYYVFPRWGVKIASQIERESDQLLDRRGLE